MLPIGVLLGFVAALIMLQAVHSPAVLISGTLVFVGAATLAWAGNRDRQGHDEELRGACRWA